MAFIFLLFIFPDFIKAEPIDSISYSGSKELENINTKESSKIFFLKEIPRTQVSIQEKNSLSTRNPFLPFGNNVDGKSGFTFSEIDFTGLASMNGEKVAFIRTSKGTNPYLEGEIIGSGFKLVNIDEKNLIIKISDDLNIYSITLDENEK